MTHNSSTRKLHYIEDRFKEFIFHILEKVKNQIFWKYLETKMDIGNNNIKMHLEKIESYTKITTSGQKVAQTQSIVVQFSS